MGEAQLVLIGVAEAVVYHHRYRSAVGDSASRSGMWAFAVCALRAAFIAVGASAVIEGAGVWQVITAYAVPAGVATWAVHAAQGRRAGSGGRDG